MIFPGQARRNEIQIGGELTPNPSVVSTDGGSGACRGKIFMTTPFRLLENAPFLENLPLKEAKDPYWWGCFQENLKIGLQIHEDIEYF